jgi:putative addiction module killer protein
MRDRACKRAALSYDKIMEVTPREIRLYITSDGRIPFKEWFDSLRDRKARVRIKLRLDRVEQGNLGDCRSVGAGIFELRIDYGPGYRVYFGQIGSTIVLILYGGDKSTQEQDISKARDYWREYEERENADQ